MVIVKVSFPFNHSQLKFVRIVLLMIVLLGTVWKVASTVNRRLTQLKHFKSEILLKTLGETGSKLKFRPLTPIENLK